MAKRRLRLACSLALAALGLGPAPAFGGAVEQLLEAAEQNLLGGETGEVERFIKRIEKIAPDAEQPISYRNLAKVKFVQGMALWQEEEQEDGMDLWREALKIDIEYPWDAAKYQQGDAESVFEGLRREVRSYKQIGLGVPQDTGATTVYVAGRQADASSRMPEGRYLVQAVCPEGDVYGRWWKYGRAPNYESLCPGGFGEAVVPVAAATDDVLFDDFGNPILPPGGAAGAQGATQEPPPEVLEEVVKAATLPLVKSDEEAEAKAKAKARAEAAAAEAAAAEAAAVEAAAAEAAAAEAAAAEAAVAAAAAEAAESAAAAEAEKAAAVATVTAAIEEAAALAVTSMVEAAAVAAAFDQEAVVAAAFEEAAAAAAEQAAAEAAATEEATAEAAATEEAIAEAAATEEATAEAVATEEATPEPASGEQHDEPEAVADAQGEQTDSTPAPEPVTSETSLGDKRDKGGSVVEKALIFGGAGSAAVGAGLYFLWVSPAYADIEDARANPAVTTASQAESLTKRFNTSRAVTAGLMGLGLVGASSGLVMHFTAVSVAPTPCGLSLQGRF